MTTLIYHKFFWVIRVCRFVEPWSRRRDRVFFFTHWETGEGISWTPSAYGSVCQGRLCFGDAHRILTLARPQQVVFPPLLFFSSFFSHSHIVSLYLFTCSSCRTFPVPSASATSFRFTFQSRQFTTTGTHWLTTFGKIGIGTFYLSYCAFNFHCFGAFPEPSFISSSRWEGSKNA
jgi:hypothetical protein